MNKIIISILIIFASIIFEAGCWELPLESEPYISMYRQDNRYFYFPGDGDEKIYLVDSQPVLVKPSKSSINQYWLYTRNTTNPQQLSSNDENSVTESNFDISKTTVFIVHGWKGHCNNTINNLLTEAFLKDDDVNVIVVDYSHSAELLYILAMMNAWDVGQDLGEFISWMTTTIGMSHENTHLVGFSLGGHIVGIAGRYNNGTIRRITALDPAGPMWYLNEKRLKNTDAQYVEVIHTNMLLYGYDGKLGDADFYPNGGIIMPECDVNVCSHSMAYHYMAKSIIYNDLIAHECTNYNEVSIDLCSGTKYAMGNSNLEKNRTGIFRVDT